MPREIELGAARAALSCDAVDWPAVVDEIDSLGLTMAELARAVGVSEQAIAAIRCGRTQEPRDRSARRILAVRDWLCSVPREPYFSVVSASGPASEPHTQ
jgi:transcriptional regulator with XRE-family HTH domain